MDQNIIDALITVVEDAFKNARDKASFLKLLNKGLNRLKADHVIAEFNVGTSEESGHTVITVRDPQGNEEQFPLNV